MILGDYLKFSPYSYLAGIAVLLASHGYVYYKGYSHEHDKFVTYTAQVSLAQAQIEADTQRRLRESAAINTDIATRLDVALRDLRKRPAVRVQPCSSAGGMPGLSIPPAGADEATVASAADSAIILTTLQCEAELIKGIEDAIKYRWLQHWINEQIEASK